MALGDVGDGVFGFGGNRCLPNCESFVVGTGSRLRKSRGDLHRKTRSASPFCAEPDGACVLPGAERRRVVGGPGVLGDLALLVLVPGPGTANLGISNSGMLPSGRVQVGYPQGRHIRRRRHAGKQVVRIG